MDIDCGTAPLCWSVWLQERLDKQYARMRQEGFAPKRFKDQLFRRLERGVEARFKVMEEMAGRCGQANKTVSA